MKNTNQIHNHSRVEKMLRANGWTPLRQFQPAKADTIGKNELFEMWTTGKTIPQTVVIHFYGDNHGVEFYFQDKTIGNDWESVEKRLAL